MTVRVARDIPRLLLLVWLTALFAPWQPARATVPWSAAQIAAESARIRALATPPVPAPHGRDLNTLDALAYFNRYRMLCDFLVRMQNTQPGIEYGGMIEGESGSDADIIQTDNTQEAIRVWSRYAVFTGDTARYAANIRRAFTYCRNFPAWLEEDGGYYAAHNCGWGFQAVMLYRQAYGDTSWNWYADSCASWVTHNALAFSMDGTTLDQVEPLAQGLAIGGLYPHALYRQRADWQNFALTQGRRLRRWFELNPARLNNNESWALCGGTALWGICESVFAQYPDSGATWLAQYGPDLDVWQTAGQWNTAFNTWYCNAQHRVFEITHDSTYWNNAVFITDSLLSLDTDRDGGIPPGLNYPVSNDHSWVSAYMGWMGIERIAQAAPGGDVIAGNFVSPNFMRPHLAGDSLTVALHVVNNCTLGQPVTLHVTGNAYADSLLVSLPAGLDSIITMPRKWVLPDNASLPVPCHLTALVAAPANWDQSNDSLRTFFDIRRGAEVAGFVSAENGELLDGARVEIYHAAYPDSAWTVLTTGDGGHYLTSGRKAMTGSNLIRVVPSISHMSVDRTVVLLPGEQRTENFILPPTQIALIDDDGGDSVETYVAAALDSVSDHVRVWHVAEDTLTSLDAVPAAVWITGRAASRTLTSSDQVLLQSYLAFGGHLILSGQNITDELGPASTFLREVLHCSTRTNNTNNRTLSGVTGSPITDGMSVYLTGAEGANNQNSPASFHVLPGASGEMTYRTGNRETCGASGTFGEGRYVFFSVGIEAVSGLNQSTTQTELLRRCLAWLGDTTTSAPAQPPALVDEFRLEPAYPNPFNPETTLRFYAPVSAGNVRLTIYNSLGQEVATLFDGMPAAGPITVRWNGRSNTGIGCASGTYYARLRSGSAGALTQPIQMVR